MKKVIRLTENDLVRIVKRVIKENGGRDHTNRLGKLNESFGNYLNQELDELVNKPLEYFNTRFGDYNFGLKRIGKNKYAIESLEDINGVKHGLGELYVDENNIIDTVYVTDEDLDEYLRATFEGSRKYDEQDIYHKKGDRWDMQRYDYYTKKHY